MNINDIEKELEDFQFVQHKIGDEGFHYCFANYSSFDNIKDENFHKARLAYLEAAKKLENYVNAKVDELSDAAEEALNNLLDSQE